MGRLCFVLFCTVGTQVQAIRQRVQITYANQNEYLARTEQTDEDKLNVAFASLNLDESDTYGLRVENSTGNNGVKVRTESQAEAMELTEDFFPLIIEFSFYVNVAGACSDKLFITAGHHQIHQDYMGTYSIHSTNSHGFVYKNGRGKYLYFWWDDDCWYMNSNPNDNNARYRSMSTANCAIFATDWESSNPWKAVQISINTYYSCDSGSGPSCESCVDPSVRRSERDCATCNAGHYLDGTTCKIDSPDQKAGAHADTALLVFIIVAITAALAFLILVAAIVICKVHMSRKAMTRSMCTGPLAETIGNERTTSAAECPTSSPAPSSTSAVTSLSAVILPPGTIVVRSDLAVPSTWENKELEDDFHTIITVDPSILQTLQNMINYTFKNIATRDRAGDTLPLELDVQTVQRIENSSTWQRYVNARATIKNKRAHMCTSIQMRAKLLTMENEHLILAGTDERVNEVYLWHGTNPNVVAEIARHGFDVNLSGSTHGAMYGNGVYFAECSSKADEYSKKDLGTFMPGCYCLLLCRVVLGESLTMSPGGDAARPVVTAALQSGLFESVVGDREAAVQTYREFVVYTGAQIYPEYIVMYKRVSGLSLSIV